MFIFQTERHFIMQVVCEATQATECKVKVAALQCLVRIMSLYYQVCFGCIRIVWSGCIIHHQERIVLNLYSYPNTFISSFQHMEAYMGPALFAITLEAMKSDVDEVALQGTLNNYDVFVFNQCVNV